MKSNFTQFPRFGYRRHCYNLEESLKTSVYISEESFKSRVNTLGYSYYGYDKCCKHLLWLDKDNGIWLFIEVA